eukprot:4817275-Pleurochrysis_carterae.AAC.1
MPVGFTSVLAKALYVSLVLRLDLRPSIHFIGCKKLELALLKFSGSCRPPPSPLATYFARTSLTR